MAWIDVGASPVLHAGGLGSNCLERAEREALRYVLTIPLFRERFSQMVWLSRHMSQSNLLGQKHDLNELDFMSVLRRLLVG